MVSCSFAHWLVPKLLWSIGRTNRSYYSTRVDLCSHQILLVGLNIDWDCLMPHCIMGSVFKIRSETYRTEAQFCQNLMIKKESLPGRPKFCRSGSAVWHLFWRLWAHVTSRNSHRFSHPNGRAVQGDCERVYGYAGNFLPRAFYFP